MPTNAVVTSFPQPFLKPDSAMSLPVDILPHWTQLISTASSYAKEEGSLQGTFPRDPSIFKLFACSEKGQ